MKEKINFNLGAVVVSCEASDLMKRLGVNFVNYLRRHASGDWGDIGASDKVLNERAIEFGGRLFSSYNLDRLSKLYVITEADRSVTTLLLAGEY